MLGTMDVRCPYCYAPAGQLCRATTRGTFGLVGSRTEPHPSRARWAAVASEDEAARYCTIPALIGREQAAEAAEARSDG